MVQNIVSQIGSHLGFGFSSDLYGKRVRPVAPFGSVSSRPFNDPALIHRSLPDELLFEVLSMPLETCGS